MFQSAFTAMLVGCACVTSALAQTNNAAKLPNFAEVEAAGATIGSVSIRIDDVFDTTQTKEDKPLFRLANRLHINTRQSVIKSQLLFRSGDVFRQSLIEESARLLRRNKFFYDATIQLVRFENNVADIVVSARDNWTLLPELALSRTGGNTRYRYGVEEDNLFGTGSAITIARGEDENRSSLDFLFSNRNVGRSWVGLDLRYRDSDDGEASRLRLVRPFFALGTRWSAGFDVFSDDREDPLFSLGDEVGRFRHEEQGAAAWFGWSKGLVDNWATRWSVGFVMSDNQFAPPDAVSDFIVVPAERDLRYPYVRYERIENRFAVANNLNNIALTEDIYLGTRFSLTLGVLSDSFNADRNGAIVDGQVQTSRGDPAQSLLSLRAGLSGRVESGDVANARFGASATYYRRQSPQRVFYARLSGVAGHELDLDQLLEFGGDTGLRGYPRAFGNGESRALLTIEQRFYTDWYPLRLFRVGAAAFVDVGRIWGSDATGFRDDRVLADAGVGLRLSSTRGNSNRVVHIDLAFPLQSDPNVDSVQVLVEVRRSF
ncbi:MAG: BamA/TamA family outer membrane protein [Pseudomonadota bacterium]